MENNPKLHGESTCEAPLREKCLEHEERGVSSSAVDDDILVVMVAGVGEQYHDVFH